MKLPRSRETSLLETGSGNNSTKITKTKQLKMTNFLYNKSSIEPDSTTQNRHADEAFPQPSLTISTATSNSVPPVGDLMAYVDVKIETLMFRIPVRLSQVQSNTIGWLTEQAAHKYSR